MQAPPINYLLYCKRYFKSAHTVDTPKACTEYVHIPCVGSNNRPRQTYYASLSLEDVFL